MKIHAFIVALFLGLACSTQGLGQLQQRYFETGGGIALLSREPAQELGLPFFPGLSFVMGKRTFNDKGRFIEAHIGIGLPTALSVKTGVGWQNAETLRTFSWGIRPYPLHGYVSWGFPNPRCSQTVSERTLKRLQRRGKDRTHLLCGEWNLSAEIGTGTPWSFWSIGLLSFSHRWYFD
jgi:hypothetical protein